MILKLLKLVLNRMDLGQMLNTKKMHLVDTFPMVYHSHCLNISFGNCRKIIWCPSLQNGLTVSQNFKNYPVGNFDRLIGKAVQPSKGRQFNLNG
jgi:hypothetical protein